MRLLTTMADEQAANTLGDALYANGIAATVNPTSDGEHAVWVHDEDKLDEAKAFLATFDPGGQQFSSMAKQARAQRRQEAKEAKRLNNRAQRMREDWEARRQMRLGTASMGIIAICVLLFFASDFGESLKLIGRFTFTPVEPIGNRIAISRGGSAVWMAEPWRLITPIFIHFSFLHIFFNMWWMKDLGTAIERTFSSRYLLAFVFVSGLLSNYLQHVVAGPSVFGGMSGVVFGLFAFVWIRGRYDPTFPYRMPQQLVVFMLIWLALGFTGWVGPIANGAHVGGLLVGAAWGFLSSGYIRRRRGG